MNVLDRRLLRARVVDAASAVVPSYEDNQEIRDFVNKYGDRVAIVGGGLDDPHLSVVIKMEGREHSYVREMLFDRDGQIEVSLRREINVPEGRYVGAPVRLVALDGAVFTTPQPKARSPIELFKRSRGAQPTELSTLETWSRLQPHERISYALTAPPGMNIRIKVADVERFFDDVVELVQPAGQQRLVSRASSADRSQWNAVFGEFALNAQLARRGVLVMSSPKMLEAEAAQRRPAQPSLVNDAMTLSLARNGRVVESDALRRRHMARGLVDLSAGTSLSGRQRDEVLREAAFLFARDSVVSQRYKLSPVLLGTMEGRNGGDRSLLIAMDDLVVRRECAATSRYFVTCVCDVEGESMLQSVGPPVATLSDIGERAGALRDFQYTGQVRGLETAGMSGAGDMQSVLEKSVSRESRPVVSFEPADVVMAAARLEAVDFARATFTQSFGIEFARY